MFFNNDHEPVESHHDLLAELFTDSDIDDIQFTVETNHGEYSVEAVTFTDPELTGFNVSGIHDQHDADRIIADVDLELSDTDHHAYVVFECGATDADEMTQAFESVLDGLGDNAEPVSAKRRHIENAGPIVGWLNSKLRVVDEKLSP